VSTIEHAGVGSPPLSPEEISRQVVVRLARKWLHTPFKHDCEVLGAGVDCAHLINAVYSEAGHMPHLTFPQYPPDWWKHTKNSEQHIVETAKRYFREITEAQAKPGDWVVMYIGKAWAHCAIITGKDRCLEAWPTRSTVEEINSKEERLYRQHAKRYFTAW
jgi:NlpC/P60 family putative phage cell wall peptidase